MAAASARIEWVSQAVATRPVWIYRPLRAAAQEQVLRRDLEHNL